jgi:ATP-dependent DNA helicase RecG
VLFVKEKGKITNAEYQKINNVSRQTASNDLSEIIDKYFIFGNIGAGAGSYYEIIK